MLTKVHFLLKIQCELEALVGTLFRAVTPGFRLLPYCVFTILESFISSCREGGKGKKSKKKNEARESLSPRGHFWEERGRAERLDFPASVPALIGVDLILIVSQIKI